MGSGCEQHGVERVGVGLLKALSSLEQREPQAGSEQLYLHLMSPSDSAALRVNPGVS